MIKHAAFFVLALFGTLLAACADNPPSTPVVQKAVLSITAQTTESASAVQDDAYALVNNQRVQLNDAGMAAIELDAGTYTVVVIEPGYASGAAEVTLTAGQPSSLAVPLKRGFAAIDYSLAIPAPANRILSNAAPDLKLQVRTAAGAVLPFDKIDSVTVRAVGRRSPSDASAPVDLSGAVDVAEAFSIQNNMIALTDPSRMKAALGGLPRGSYLLDVAAYDTASGILYSGEVMIEFGSSALSGRLTAGATPASIAGATVKLGILGTGIELSATTDATGAYAFADIPAGNVQVTVEVDSGGQTFRADELIFVDGNTTANLALAGSASAALTQAEVFRVGARPYSVDPQRAVVKDSLLASQQALPMALSAEAISVTGAARDVAVKAQKTYKFDASATSTTVRYIVNTVEYPAYVLQQSIYNDVWSVTALSSTGKALAAVTRSVNSQLSNLPPYWRADGSTGEQELPIDLSGVAVGADGKKTVVLAIQTKNIGDGALPTTVRAEIVAAPFRVEIGSLSEVPPGCAGCRAQNVTSISIPRLGETNAFDRTVQVDLVQTGATPVTVSQITNVKISANIGGAPVVIYEASSAPNAQSTTRFLAPLAFRSPASASPFQTNPPPNTTINYTIEVTANQHTATASTPAYTALWRAATASRSGLFSGRDLPGGDDWAAQSMYFWLLANHASLPRQNDISGEHGQDLGHTTHRFGGDIDLFLFGAELNGVRARDNQYAVEAVARTAMGTNATDAAAALTTLTAWVEAQRVGIRRLCDDADVRYFYGPRGRALAGGIPRDWVLALIENGTVAVGTRSLTVGGGYTPCGKFSGRSDHDDHYHVGV